MARILKYRGGGMAPNSAASKLAKMLRSYRNGGYVYAQGSDEVPTTLTPGELAILKKFGLSPNGGGEVPTGSSAPQAMTREEYLAFPENFRELFGIDSFLEDQSDATKAGFEAILNEENLRDFWNQVVESKGGQKLTLPMTGQEWDRPRSLEWLAKEGPGGEQMGFGSEYIIPKKMLGGDYHYALSQPKADIYYHMLDPQAQRRYQDLLIPSDDPNEWQEQYNTRNQMLRQFGPDAQRNIEQRLIEEAIRAKVKARDAGAF